ncbi:replication protein A 70 kDa DNA-binding subunit, partial [Contarinia nasturtii]|uniref:replication protein A 70 kDa DNA-binding subunit n=1 Tax=Contarinia nasturtii TaxID=265458 RepID=UPI0012D41C2C
MSTPALTTGCLMQIMTTESYEGEPILQVLGSKRIAGGNAERYRLLLSDGQYLQSFSMLSTQLNHLVVEGQLPEFSIIQVKQHITSVVNKNENDESRRVLIIVALEILKSGTEVNGKIGDPISLSDVNKQKPAVTSAESPRSVLNTNSNSNALPPQRTQKPTTTNMNESVFDGRATLPISGLSPYQNKWVIKARVTAKAPIRHWSNAKGEGKLFSMDLMDESGQIRVTAFRDLVDKFYDMIEVDKVYFFSKGQLKPANKQFSNIPNDYELTLSSDSVIQECKEDLDDVPTVKYDFISIDKISDKQPNTIVDVIGVCRDVGELQAFTAKSTGKELKKRDITLVDNTDASVNLTLWNVDAENFNDYGQPVLLVKGGRVSEFGGGKSISMVGSTVLKKNPDLPEGHFLRGWFDNGGGREIRNSISAQVGGGGGNFNTEWLTFHEAKLKNLGNGDKPDYFQVKGTIQVIRNQNPVYKACPQDQCKKKVVDMQNGQYRCENCNIESANFKYRMIVNMSIADWTSNRWATVFADDAEKMLGNFESRKLN